MSQDVPYKKPTDVLPAMVREQDIETEFQKRLESLKYTPRPDIRDRATLEQNFRQKFEALNHVRLTDSEFARLLDEIITPDVFTAARTLRERNAFDGARLVPAGTLLMLTRGMTLLKDVPICVLRREMSFNQDVKGLCPKDDVDGLFLKWMLTGNKERLLTMVDIAGRGTGKLDTDELKALALIVPKPPEQQSIASCLSSLDALITAETQELEALKTHKRGLMKQLFPTPEDA